MHNTEFYQLNYLLNHNFTMVFNERLKQLEDQERNDDLDEEDENELKEMRKDKVDRKQMRYFHDQHDYQFRKECADALGKWCGNMGFNIPKTDIIDYIVERNYDIETVQNACYMLYGKKSDKTIFTSELSNRQKLNQLLPKTYDSFIKLDLTIQKYFSTGFSFES